VPARGLQTLTLQKSPVASDRLWVIVNDPYHHITVSDGELGGERAPSRRYL
jgi:hypothetical protein